MKKILAVFLVAIISNQLYAETSREDEIVWAKEDDPEMNKAITQARSTLDSFLSKHKKNPSNIDTYKLKVMVSDSNGVEHFWVLPFKNLGNDNFEGIIANEPRVVRSVENGELINFKRNKITDWGYVQDGKQIGSYTVCALFKSMPKEQVKYYVENHGFECQNM